LEYAPKWAQRGEAGVRAIATESTAAPPAGAPGAGTPEPPWQRKRRPGSFEGDIAIIEMRASLALSPDQIPEPPRREGRAPGFATVGRLVMVAALATAGAYGFLWLSAPPSASSAPQPVLAADQDAASTDLAGTAAGLTADRTPPPGGLAPFSVADYARSLTDGAGMAPTGPVRGVLPPPSADATPDRDEIAALLARSRAYLAAGDVAAARLVLRRAVAGGDVQAALALGSTYDPIVLKRLGVVSFAADPAQAREWYRRAADLGSADAPQRIEQLAQADR